MKSGKRQPLSLKGRALAWLAQREHSRSELRRKLLRLVTAAERTGAAHREADSRNSTGEKVAATAAFAFADEEADVPEKASSSSPAAPGFSPADVDTLLDWLEAHGYLSEARFVEGRIRARSARYGNLRIRQELAQHGVEPDDETVRALRDSEFRRAHEVWTRKFGSQPPREASERARQMRFLASRGFSADVVRCVVRGAGQDASGEDDIP